MVPFLDRPDLNGESSSFCSNFDWEASKHLRGGSYRGLGLIEPLCTRIVTYFEILFEERGTTKTVSLVVHDSDGITLATFEDIALVVATCGGMKAPRLLRAHVVLSVLEPSEEQI